MLVRFFLGLLFACALCGSAVPSALHAQDEEAEAKVDPELLQAFEAEQLAYRKFLDEFVKISSQVEAKKDVPAAVEKIAALQKEYIASFHGKQWIAKVPDAVRNAVDAKLENRPEGKKFGPEMFRLAGNDHFGPVLDTMKALEVLDSTKAPKDPNAAPPKSEWSIEPIAGEPAVAMSKAEVDLPGHRGDLTAIALSPDGKRLASAAHGKDEKLVRSIRIWNLKTGQAELLLQGPHPGEYWSGFGALAFTPDGVTLVTSDSNGEVQTWDLQNRRAGKPLKFITSFNAFAPIALSGDGKVAAIAFPGGVKAMDVASGKVLAERPGLGNPAPITAVAASSDGKLIATAIDTLGDPKRPTLELWSLTEKKLLWRSAPQQEFLGLYFSPDDKHLLALEETRRLFRFDVATGKADEGVKTDSGEKYVQFSRDGGRMLSVDGFDATLVATQSGEKLAKFGGYSKIPHLRAAALSADGAILALGGEKGFLRLFKTESAEEEAQPSAPAEKFRTWSSVDGKFKIDAKLISFDDESVILERKDGKEVNVPRAKLSPADRRYLASRPAN